MRRPVKSAWVVHLVAVHLVVFTAVAMALVAMSCDRDPPAQGPPTATDDPVTSEGFPGDVEVQRIASMAPSITELLFALGLGEKVVAVTRYCDYPPEATDRAVIGGMLDPDYEAMLAAEPDLVLGVKDGADHRMVQRLDAAGIAYGFLTADDLAGVRASMELLGEWLGADEAAAELRRRFDDELHRAARDLEGVWTTEDGPPPRGIVVFDHEPIVAAGPGTFAAELLGLAGLENALGDDFGAYPVLDMEGIYAVDPGVILDVSIGPTSREVQAFWARFDRLQAVEAGAVLHIDDPLMMRPGPRLPEALRLMGQAAEEL